MDKVKNKYFFPNVMAVAMSKVDQRTQFEASMMSMFLILCGLVLSGFYILFYVSVPLWYKITIVINVLAGIVFLSSFLVTTFQQYQSYMQAKEIQDQLKEEASFELSAPGLHDLNLKGGVEEDAKEN